jgi:hypothetical protein
MADHWLRVNRIVNGLSFTALSHFKMLEVHRAARHKQALPLPSLAM